MELGFFLTLVFIIIGFVIVFVFLTFLWKKVVNEKENQGSPYDNNELKILESLMKDRIDMVIRILNSQTTLITAISSSLGTIRKNEDTFEKKPVKTSEEEIKIDNEALSKDPGNDVIPRLTPEDAEIKLESLLNGTDFTVSIWQQFSKPFDICAHLLVMYLAENGLPSPRIEPYPPMQDNNPNFWKFMIVALNWKADGKRFVIPRNYERYDPLWHEHLFNVRGNVNKPDNYINGLVRCAELKNGELSGYIDKKLLEREGIIEVE